jgi:hypothetical protein
VLVIITLCLAVAPNRFRGRTTRWTRLRLYVSWLDDHCYSTDLQRRIPNKLCLHVSRVVLTTSNRAAVEIRQLQLLVQLHRGRCAWLAVAALHAACNHPASPSSSSPVYTLSNLLAPISARRHNFTWHHYSRAVRLQALLQQAQTCVV